MLLKIWILLDLRWVIKNFDTFFVECNSLEQISALKTILMGTNIVKKESFLFKTFTEKMNCYSNIASQYIYMTLPQNNLFMPYN